MANYPDLPPTVNAMAGKLTKKMSRRLKETGFLQDIIGCAVLRLRMQLQPAKQHITENHALCIMQWRTTGGTFLGETRSFSLSGALAVCDRPAHP